MAHSLIPRIEQATAEQVRELLEEAWLEIHHEGYPPENERDTCRKCDRFARLLDAEAWTSAAELLVPDGYKWAVTSRNSACCQEKLVIPLDWTFAATPALALAAACLRAKGLQAESHSGTCTA